MHNLPKPQPKQHILIIDDDHRIRDLLKKYLQSHNYHVSATKDTTSARAYMEYFTFDLIIMDLMLPGETGQEFTIHLRLTSDIPILMLTAMSDVEQRIAGLEIGADDYLGKPFEPKELLLRISRILARSNTTISSDQTIQLGDLEFNLTKRSLRNGAQFIPLTSSEANLLHLLAANKGQIMTREFLANLCGGVNERSIDVQIMRLRGKLEQDPKNPLYLQTARGEGYVLYTS